MSFGQKSEHKYLLCNEERKLKRVMVVSHMIYKKKLV